jgi:hypothetical protein
VRRAPSGIGWLGGGGGEERQEQDEGFGIHDGIGKTGNSAMEAGDCERIVWRRAQKC